MTDAAQQYIDLFVIPRNVPSLCIPRVFKNINEGRIRKCFEDLDIGRIDRVDIVPVRKGEDTFNRVFVHLQWKRSDDADSARTRLLSGKEIKIIYDDPWFWKVSVNRSASRDDGRDLRRNDQDRYEPRRGDGRDLRRDDGRDSRRDQGRDPRRDQGRDSRRDQGRDLRRDDGRDLRRDQDRYEPRRDNGRDLRRDQPRPAGNCIQIPDKIWKNVAVEMDKSGKMNAIRKPKLRLIEPEPSTPDIPPPSTPDIPPPSTPDIPPPSTPDPTLHRE